MAQDKRVEDMGTEELISDIINNMTGGNPGAVAFLVELHKNCGSTYKWIELTTTLCVDMNLRGEQLYKIWNDCCQRDTKRAIKVIEAIQMRWITTKYAIECINQPYGIKIELPTDPLDPRA